MKRRYKILNFMLFSVFAFYLVILFVILFYSRYSQRGINIVPFRSVISYLTSNDIILRSFSLGNLLGNIALFIPMGIYLTLFNRNKKIYTNILWLLSFSLLVEIVQFVFAIGVIDIDDIILNCLGGFIGIVTYKALLFKFKDDSKVRNIISIFAPIGAIVSLAILFIYNNVM